MKEFSPGDKVKIDPGQRVLVSFTDHYPEINDLYKRQGYLVVAKQDNEWLRFRDIDMSRNGRGWLSDRFVKIGTTAYELPEELFEL